MVSDDYRSRKVQLMFSCAPSVVAVPPVRHVVEGLGCENFKFQALGYSVVLEADGVGQGGGWHELLNSAIYIFDNKVLSENSLLGKTMEVEKKKGKSKGAKVDTEDEDEQEDAKRQEVVKVEMLVAEPVLDDVVVEEKTSARMKLAGKLSCRAYLPPGATVSWAR